MFLKLPTEQGKERNRYEAFKRGCQSTTKSWWGETEIDVFVFLDVKDGDGLTADELAQCVDDLPI